MTSNTVHVITGGSLGIGLALVKQLSERPNTVVIATARVPKKAEELQEWIKTHPNVHAVAYDANKPSDARQLAVAVSEISADGVDILHANAGIFESFTPVVETSLEEYEKHLRVNFLGPVDVFQSLYPLLLKRDTRKVIFTSTIAASIASYGTQTYSAYGAGKAALNLLANAVSKEYKDQGFTSIALHPGMVLSHGAKVVLDRIKAVVPAEQYDQMVAAALSTEESARLQLATIDGLKEEQNGKFVDVHGDVLPY